MANITAADVKKLRDALSFKGSEIKKIAAEMLGYFKDKGAVEFLIPLCKMLISTLIFLIVMSKSVNLELMKR